MNSEEYELDVGVRIDSTRAITLISLVITIIILIILAGVGINLSLGENGIFRRAKEARDKYLTAEEVQIRKNIYDIAGNVIEWTDEAAYIKEDNAHSTWWTRMPRGGSFLDNYGEYPVCARSGFWSKITPPITGFRVALFLK